MRRGFTIVEVLLASAAAAVLALAAWPSYRQQLLRSGRSEAVNALGQLQAAQEQHREMFGHYAADLQRLGTATVTAGGRYALTLQLDGAEAYQAIARPQGRQHDDAACPALTLRVVQGFASEGPDGRCWNR